MELLLREWNIPQDIITNFNENDVTVDQLKEINDNILKELCPKIGLRIELKKKIDEYLVATSTTNTVTNSSITAPYLFTDNEDLEDLHDILTGDIYVRPNFPDFDLKTLLTVTPCGKSILNYYTANSTLTNKHRNQLTDIIVRHLFTRVVNYKITYEEYNILTAKIIALFPCENTGTYFVPPIKKRQSISGKPSFAKGKLVDKIRNTLYKSGEKRKKSTPEENVIPNKIKKYEELKEDHTDQIIFLKNNNEPWSEIIDCWNKTFQVRQCSTNNNISDFIDEWNILNDPRSDSLINLDFERLYPERSTCFFKNWKWFINKIISLKFGESKDETLSTLYESIQEQPDDDLKVPDQIKLLSYLIPPRGRLNKRRKFSTLECVENFIIYVQNPGDIQTKIDEVKDKALRSKQSVQPYVIKCGAADDGNDNYYLVIDKVMWKFTSPMKAFDTLFKSYHALHATYPQAAAHLYVLIQRCVYQIETKYDKIVPYIADLLSLAKM